MLDLTIVSDDVTDKVINWRVDDVESLSDHKYIRNEVKLGKPEPVLYRNRRKTDRTKYREYVSIELMGLTPSEISCIEQIDDRVDSITKIERMGLKKPALLRGFAVEARQTRGGHLSSQSFGESQGGYTECM